MITTCDDMCWLSPHVLELSGLGVGVQCRGPFLLLSFVVLPHARGTARGTVSNSTMLSCLLLCCVCSDFLLQCDAMCVSMPLCVAMLLLVTISMVWVSPLSPRRSQTNTRLQTEWTMPGIAWSLASCFGGRFWKLNQRHCAKGSSIVSNYYWQCFTFPHLCQQCIRTYGGGHGISNDMQHLNRRLDRCSYCLCRHRPFSESECYRCTGGHQHWDMAKIWQHDRCRKE